MLRLDLEKENAMTHVVALSGGKDSTALALRLAEIEPRDYTYVCTPTGNEPDEMFAHWRRLGEILGKRITPVVHPLGLKGLIQDQNAIPNRWQRWCTRMLKIEPYRNWLALHAPATSYVGLRADEEGRIGGVYDDIPDITMRFPLREWGWTEDDVWDYLKKRDIAIPKRTDCDWCFFQRLDEWHWLWLTNLPKYLDAEAQETTIGHTFRSPSRDTQPTSLAGLREKFEQGYVPQQRHSALKAAQCRVCTL
jgi:3'-phosphoadenosine 5'-phosphosulfate sulfotransferase (PAPS reductase)/FAD synthetase